MIGPIWIYPLNLIIGIFSSYRIGSGFFVRGVGAVLLSIVLIALLLELIYDKISWYRLKFDGDRVLFLEYRAGLFDSYKQLSFSLRYTKIQYFRNLMWIVSTENDQPLSILLTPPEEELEKPFYDDLNEKIDEYYYKVRKHLEKFELSDIESHYMFVALRGKIKQINTRQFELLTGIINFYPEYGVEDDDEIKYIKDESPLLQGEADHEEYEQIMNDAPTIKIIK